MEAYEDRNCDAAAYYVSCEEILTDLYGSLQRTMDAQMREIHDVDNRLTGYRVQTFHYRQFLDLYKQQIFALYKDYSFRASGPCKDEKLARFCHTTLRLDVLQRCQELAIAAASDKKELNEKIENLLQQLDRIQTKQAESQAEAQEVLKSITTRAEKNARDFEFWKNAIASANDDLDQMLRVATDQRIELEKNAFESVHLPFEKARKAEEEAQKLRKTEGYMLKRCRDGTVLSLLRGESWKLRYFTLSGASLTYGKTKDELERGHCRKEIRISGCEIRDSSENMEIQIVPNGNEPHIYRIEKENMRPSLSECGRVITLKPTSMEQKSTWIDILRRSAKV